MLDEYFKYLDWIPFFKMLQELCVCVRFNFSVEIW